MGLQSAMNTALTGMQAAETTIDVVGNNVANANTVGFKESNVLFATQFMQTQSIGSAPSDSSGGTNPRQIGLGAKVAEIAPDFTQGTIEVSANPLDLAIQGDGFFEVQLPDGSRAYTRDGAFKSSSDGRIVTSDGLPLQGGFQPVPAGTTNITIGSNGDVTYSGANGSTSFQVQLVRFNNPTWWPPMSGHAFSARVLGRILPMPESPFRVGADYYLVRASTLCGPVVSVDRVGAYYRRHGRNEDLRDRLDLDQVRTQIDLTREGHRWLKEFAASIEEPNFAADASEVADLRYAALCLISKKLDPGRHPLSGDSLVGLARRGMRVARSQSHLPWRVRAMAALWFPAVLLAPRGPARALATAYSYPRTRPWLSRFLRRS